MENTTNGEQTVDGQTNAIPNENRIGRNPTCIQNTDREFVLQNIKYQA